MSNELVKQEQNTELMIPDGSWGAEDVSAKDIIISKLLLQQALSQFVIAGQCKSGDMVDSVTAEVLGDKNRSVEVIPLKMFKTWVIEIQDGTKWKYLRQDPVTPENVNEDPMAVWEETLEIKGKKVNAILRRNLAMNYYVMLADRILNPDALPMVVMFRRTSLQAGKKISTHFVKCSMAKKPPACKTIKLICKQMTNDNGTFWIFDSEVGRDTTSEELAKAYNWYKQIATTSHKVDESDELQTDAIETKTESKNTVEF